MSGPTLFGIPTMFDDSERARWIHQLTRTWRVQTGRAPEDLDDDLALLAPLFRYGVSAKTVRAKVYDMKPADTEVLTLSPETLLTLEGRTLVTPEGRILLDVLLRTQERSSFAISDQDRVDALQRAVSLRASWHNAWLNKQFDGTLSAPALGAALFLLINGSVGAAHALVMPREPERDLRLGGLILPILAGFNTRLGARNELDTETGIRQHWAFTQVSRFLARDVERESNEDGTSIFVILGRELALVDAIATRLERSFSSHIRRSAVEGFADDYRRVRGNLASLGLAHEDPTVTRRILRRLTDPSTAK